MNFKHHLLIGAAAMVALTGCIDDKYDLANVDTTSEFKVNDLVLPLNMDPVLLNDIITIKENDELKKVEIAPGDTIYAVQKSGTFNSDDIEVNTFTATSDPIEDSHAYFELQGGAQMSRGKAAPGATVKNYLILQRVDKRFSYNDNSVDPSVRSLTYLWYDDLTFEITVTCADLNSNIDSHIESLVLTIPDGLTVTNVEAPGYTFKASDYDASTGRLNLGTINVENNTSSILVTSTAIDLKNYGTPLYYDEASNESIFDLESGFVIEDGCLLVLESSAENLASLPDELDFTVQYKVSPLTAKEILGSLQYDLEGTGLTFDPVELGNLPDFLDNPKTNLLLANPQIYLNMDNPVGQYGLGYSSGLNILAIREDGTSEFPLDSRIEVPQKAGSFNFLLAPNPDAAYPSKAYPGEATEIKYPALRNMLSGEGLPESLDIELISAAISEQPLKAPFKLGVKIPGMTGNYEFLAPLALEAGSKIIYTKTQDGWWDEDLADLTITDLKVTTTATSNIPLDAELKVHPLDKDGNLIPGLQIIPAIIAAKEGGQDLMLEVKGTIQNLDGIFISADVDPDGSLEVLTPEQEIMLENIRVMVSGSYTKKL